MTDERIEGAAAAGGGEAPWRVLCVDDEPNILSALRRLFRQSGYVVEVAGSGSEGLAALERAGFDLVISDMRMPEMDGAQFLEQVRKRWPETVRILLTGYSDIGSTIEAINKGQIFRYVSKPWDDDDLRLTVRHALERKALEREKLRLEALTARQNEELREINASLERKVAERTAELRSAHEKLKLSFLTSIKIFANLIELREGTLAGHSRRVADLARRIATKMELGPGELQDVFLAGLLHDIGKIGLPDELLSKPVSHMSGDDLGQYRKHPVKGEQSLMALEELRNAARLLRSHHERFDGLGYPDGLVGLAIPLGARILAVANEFDGLQIGIVAPRRLSAEEAKKLIAEGRGRRFDPQVVDAFLEIMGGAETSTPVTDLTVPVAALKPGMVLARDLVSRDGVLLLAADYILDENLIRQIRDYARVEGIQLSLLIRNDRRAK
ncbi:MAG: response regulator [Rhodocyclaceae bacterium]|nr:response regulator [Rhodocyclaceae bacterium]